MDLDNYCYEGETYQLKNNTWINSKTCFEPPKYIQTELNLLRANRKIGDSIVHLSKKELYDEAKKNRDLGNYKLTRKYLIELLRRNPNNGSALSIYSSLLRSKGRAKDALIATDAYCKKFKHMLFLQQEPLHFVT